jgi:hypothetical protein
MSCCGQSNGPQDPSNPATPYRQPIDQQPSPHPGAQIHNKSHSFQQPNLTAPTPMHSYNQNSYAGQNGHQAQQPSNWSQHSPSPPPVNQFGVYGLPAIAAASNSYPQAQYQPQLNLIHNPSLRGGTSSPPTSMTSPLMTSISAPRQDFRPPSDEGKVSVAIDFGECQLVVVICGQVIPFRYHIFGSGLYSMCCEYGRLDTYLPTGIWLVSHSCWQGPANITLARILRNI